MKNNDFLIRGLFKNLNIRFVLTETTSVVTDGILIHSCDPTSASFFSRALTVASLLNPLLNTDEKYSVNWEYMGEIGRIIVDVTDKNEIRGIPSKNILNSSLSDMAKLFGESGYITMIKFKEGKILNSGKSKAGLLDISGDVAFFMSTSDQIETELLTEVIFNSEPTEPVKISAGFMLQEMPGADLAALNRFRNLMNTDDFKSILLAPDLSAEKKLQNIIEFIDNSDISYAEIENRYDISFSSSNPPVYKCSCNLEKMKAAVKTLSKEDLLSIIQKQETIKISCHFCNKKYEFDPSDFESHK